MKCLGLFSNSSYLSETHDYFHVECQIERNKSAGDNLFHNLYLQTYC